MPMLVDNTQIFETLRVHIMAVIKTVLVFNVGRSNSEVSSKALTIVYTPINTPNTGFLPRDLLFPR